MNDKNKQWQQMWERYRETDSGVRETVAALNLLGINTMASCEGHMTHGESAAWIDVAAEMTEELANLNKQADELQERAGLLLKELDNDHPAHKLWAEYEVVRDQILKINLQMTTKLEDLLREFYKNREIDIRVKLVINIYGRGVGRLISQGGLYQEAYEKEQQRKFMEEYLQEMKEFGKFLKGKV